MTKEDKVKLVEEYRANCNGFDTVYSHPLRRGVVYSEGCRYVAETCGAYWLLDAIMSHITPRLLAGAEGFAVFTLKLNKTGSGAKLEANDGGKGDGGAKRLAFQRIEYTDFPVKEITFFLEGTDEHGYTLMLKEER